MPPTAVHPTRTGTVPWPAEVATRYLAEGYWAGRPLGAYLTAAARANPAAIALVDGDLRLSYRELMSRADGAAARLVERGVSSDDRVVVQLPNCWEHIVLTVACLRLGAVPVWALPEHRLREITGVAARAEARVLVVPARHREFDHRAMAHEVAATVPSIEHVLVTGSADPGEDLGRLCEPAADPAALSARFDAAAPDATAVATFLLSGGTTGTPKLVPRTHNDLAYMVGEAARLCEFGPDTAYLAALPLGHGFPYTGPGVLGALMSGGRVVIAASPAPGPALATIERERVTATSIVPAIALRWLAHHAAHPGRDLGSLRLVQIGAARLEPDAAARIEPELGGRLQQVFGMGEGLLCLTRLDDPPAVVHHTQGRPISPADEVLIVDDEDQPVRPGEAGALLTRGPYTLRGYYRSPEIDAASFLADGWYRTGDIVRQTPDGNLVVTGREKDLINRGGEKVSAVEVEGFALALDGVTQAAAVAMSDAELGERVCLFVVPAGGARVDLADVRASMLDRGVAAFKLPDRLVSVDTLPMTPLGKIDKKALRDQIPTHLDTA